MNAGELDALDPAWSWARYQPSAENPWSLAKAAHLFRRAGFGGTWRELQDACARGPNASIDAMLRPPAGYAAFADEFDGHESAAARSADPDVYVSWWVRRLRQTPWPFLEKLTLFWHGYFAVAAAPAGDPRLTQAHVQKVRENATADFATMIAALANDPAMYAGLGGEQNRKARPNLHFSRPWLEAFTIGAEAANVSAVTNLARAWTGWFLYGGKLRFVEREHDAESKHLLGQEGNWGRDEAIRLLAADPATARNVARRLFQAFVSESARPPEPLLAPLAERIGRGARLQDVVELILRSNLFFSEHAFGQRIKSPVELVVSLVRSLEGMLPAAPVAGELANLGQRLDAPPTVQGWAGGANWLNTITLAGRLQLCEALVRGSAPYGTGLDPGKVAAQNGFNTLDAQVRFLVDLLLAGQLAPEVVTRIGEAAGSSADPLKAALSAILARPEFQLN